MLPQYLSAKAAAIGLAAVLAGATAAAASTGSLPAPAQSAVSTTLSHVGVSVPDPDAHVADQRDETTTTSAPESDHHADEPRGPDATGPARTGLCRAWTAHDANGHQPNDSSVAFRNLERAATDAGQSVADYCKDVTPTTHDTTDDARPDDGSASSTTSTTTPVETPNRGGTGTAHDASDGHSDKGTSHAPDAATLGSGNAQEHGSSGH